MSLFYIHFHKTVVESSGGSRWSTEQSTQWCHLSDWVCVCVCVWKSYAMALEPLSPRWKIFSSFLGPLSYSSKTHTHTRKDVQVVFCICVVLRSDCVLSRCHNSTWTNLLFFFFCFSLCDTALCRVTYVWKPEDVCMLHSVCQGHANSVHLLNTYLAFL